MPVPMKKSGTTNQRSGPPRIWTRRTPFACGAPCSLMRFDSAASGAVRSRARYPRSLTALLAGTALIVFGAFEADAVESQAEIQINLCSDSTKLVSALNLAEKGKPATVWLFDTPGLDLDRNGLRLRLRERGKLADLTLKVAGQDCSKVDASLVGGQGKCEADLHGDSFEDVVSLERRLDRRSLNALLGPEARRGAALAHTLSTLLTTNQRNMIGAKRGVAAPAPLPPEIKRLGPSIVRAYRAAGQPYVVEVWALPGGERFAELSQKVPRETALARRTELEAKISAAGVSICADQLSQARNKLTILAR
jgi:hypothetical protein